MFVCFFLFQVLFSLWKCCGCSPRLGHGSSSTPTDWKPQSLLRAQPPAVDPMVLAAGCCRCSKVWDQIALLLLHCIQTVFYFIVFCCCCFFAPRVNCKKFLSRRNVATLLGGGGGGMNFIFCRISSLEASSCLIPLTNLSHLSMIASAGCSAECLSRYIF